MFIILWAQIASWLYPVAGLRDTLVYIVIKWSHNVIVSPTLSQFKGGGGGVFRIYTLYINVYEIYNLICLYQWFIACHGWFHLQLAQAGRLGEAKVW